MGQKTIARNASYIKAYNKHLILKLIRQHPASRSEAARMTGLTRAAVTHIVDGLVNEGLVLETGVGNAGLGRKPVLLQINPESSKVLGLDISRNGCSLGVVGLDGKVLSKADFKLDTCKDHEAAVKQILSHIHELIKASKLPVQKIIGLGISAPGPLDSQSGIILNPPDLDLWKDAPIVQNLKMEFPFPIYLENNSNALAQAEQSFGTGKAYHNFLLIVVDTGIGAGIILNDRLYRGKGGFGSEIGHMSINMAGDPCPCGNFGCVEVSASMPAILRYARTRDSQLDTWKKVVDRALAQDPICGEILVREAGFLAAMIVNAFNLLELEAVILTGDILYKADLLVGIVSKIVNAQSITRCYFKKEIRVSSISADAPVISAAEIVAEKYFNGEIT